MNQSALWQLKSPETKTRKAKTAKPLASKMAAIKKKLHGQNKVGTSELPIVIKFCPSVNLNETFQLSQQEVNAIIKIQEAKDAQNFLFKTIIQINQCVSNLFISNLFYEKVFNEKVC